MLGEAFFNEGLPQFAEAFVDHGHFAHASVHFVVQHLLVPADALRTAVEFADPGEDDILALRELAEDSEHLLLVGLDGLLGVVVAVTELLGDVEDDAGQEEDGADHDGGDDERDEKVRVGRRWRAGSENRRGDHGCCA